MLFRPTSALSLQVKFGHWLISRSKAAFEIRQLVRRVIAAGHCADRDAQRPQQFKRLPVIVVMPIMSMPVIIWSVIVGRRVIIWTVIVIWSRSIIVRAVCACRDGSKGKAPYDCAGNPPAI